MNGTLVGSSLRGSVTHFSKGFVGKFKSAASTVLDASVGDAASDAQVPTDSGSDTSTAESGSGDASVTDSGDAGKDAAVTDAATDGPASCVAFPPPYRSSHWSMSHP